MRFCDTESICNRCGRLSTINLRLARFPQGRLFFVPSLSLELAFYHVSFVTGADRGPDLFYSRGDLAANPLIPRSLEKIYRDAKTAATGNEPVLILGETGVGKEMLARHIYAQLISH